MHELTAVAACMLLGPGTNAARQRAEEPEVKPSQLNCSNSSTPINNVEVKNIKSVGCAGLNQLQEKCFNI